MKTVSLKIPAGAVLAVALVSCGIVGGALGLKDVPMDAEDVAVAVKGAVANGVDTSVRKIYEISWSEEGKLTNNLAYIRVQLVDKDGDYCSQSFHLNDDHDLVAEEIKMPSTPKSARHKIVYEEVTGIDVNKLDGAQIVKQLEAAKALIPEEYEFRSVESYSIEEDVHRVGMIDEMMARTHKKSNKKYGAQRVRFTLNVVKKGEKSEWEGRRVVTNYYSIPFVVKEDGSVEMVED